MSVEDFDEVKIMDQRPEKCLTTICPRPKKTKMAELNFGEVVICMLCQLLSGVIFFGRGSGRAQVTETIFIVKTYFLSFLPIEAPKWHFLM